MTANEKTAFPGAARHHEAGHRVARRCSGAWTQYAEVFSAPETVSPGGGGNAAFRTHGRFVGAHILPAWPPVGDRARRIAGCRGEMDLVIDVTGAVETGTAGRTDAATPTSRSRRERSASMAGRDVPVEGGRRGPDPESGAPPDVSDGGPR